MRAPDSDPAATTKAQDPPPSSSMRTKLFSPLGDHRLHLAAKTLTWSLMPGYVSGALTGHMVELSARARTGERNPARTFSSQRRNHRLSNCGARISQPPQDPHLQHTAGILFIRDAPDGKRLFVRFPNVSRWDVFACLGVFTTPFTRACSRIRTQELTGLIPGEKRSS